jgi:WD40 repeat protein
MQISFLIGLNTINNSFISLASFDENTKKITNNEIFNFEEACGQGSLINNVLGIYPVQDGGFFTQVYNQSAKSHQLKYITKEQDKFILKSEIKNYDDLNIFDVQVSDDKLYQITNQCIRKLDINLLESEDVIKFSNEELVSKPQIKITSDISLVERDHILIGLSSDLKLFDLSERKTITTIKGAHPNGVLSCEFDPLKPTLICSSGMDNTIKFWDLRKPSSPISGIYNNSHWVWACKYNKTYSRILSTCSSSSIVRSIVFEKENEENSHNHPISTSDLNHYSLIDYIEFEDSVYSLDWSHADPWIFAAVSFNSYLHINTIPEDIKLKVMLDN